MDSSKERPSRKIHVLTFSTLYPNQIQKRHGIFVETRIKHLRKKKGVEIVTVAPIPWFPFKHSIFGQYGKYARVPRREERNGITVYHPRYLVIPKIGMSMAPFLMAISVWPFVRKLHKKYDFDIIDGHFLYPDGVVAVILARLLNLPVINTARGSDINLYPSYWFPRQLIRWAINKSNAIISVCNFLSFEIEKLDVNQPINIVLRNGVDLETFAPRNRKTMRKLLGLCGFTIISVGNFIEGKGHHLVIEALKFMPDVTLILVGDGPMEKKLQFLVKKYGLNNRVIFSGILTQNKLAEYYSAADCLVLASSREGWANVLLEAMACGTPVVATKVSGTPEIILNSTAGYLIDSRSAKGISSGIAKLRSCYPDRDEVRKYAAMFSWEEVVDDLDALITRVVDGYNK